MMKKLFTFLGLILTSYVWAQSVDSNTNYNISISNRYYLTAGNDPSTIKFDTLVESFKANAVNQSWLTGANLRNTTLSCSIAGKTYYLVVSLQKEGEAIKTTTTLSMASTWDVSAASLKLLASDGRATSFQINNVNGTPKLGKTSQTWNFTTPFAPFYTDSFYTFMNGSLILTSDSSNDKPAMLSGRLSADNSQAFSVTGTSNGSGNITAAQIIANGTVYLVGATADKPIKCLLNSSEGHSWQIEDDGFGNVHMLGKDGDTNIGWLDEAGGQPVLQRTYSPTRPTQKWKFTKAVRTAGGWGR